MLRIKFLAVMCLGLLMACGSNEPGERQPGSEEPLGQVRAAVITSSTPSSFGEQLRGTTSTPQTVTLTNNLSSNSIVTLHVGTGQPFLYNVGSGWVTDGTVTVPDKNTNNGKKSIQVEFAPTAVGAATGTLTVSYGSGPTTFDISLSGTGVSSATVDATSLTFPPQKTGTFSKPQSVVVSNTSPSAFNITGLQVTGPFAVSNPSTLPSSSSPLTVAGNGNSSISVVFHPASGVTPTGTLTITTDEPSTLTVPLSGTQVALATQVSANSLPSFGEQRVRTTSAAQTVTLRNDGDTPLNITASITGPFALVSPPSTPLAAGASQDLSVTFNPSAEGAVTGALNIATNEVDPNDSTKTISASVSLSGTGVMPNLAWSANPLDFGDQRVGAAITKTVTLDNSQGTGPISITSIVPSGSTDFTLVSPPSTPFTLAAGAHVDLSVQFLPSTGTTTPVTGDISLNTGDPELTTLSVHLSGRGVRPNVVVNPNPLDFGDQRLGTSVTKTVSVANTGTGPIVITRIATSGSSAFTLVSSPSSLPFTLAANASLPLTLTVTFSPATETTTPVTGAITLTTQDTDFPSVAINLSGRGVRPNLGLSPNPLAFGDLRVGTTLTNKLTVSNSGTGPITLSTLALSGSSAFTLVSSPSTPFTLGAGQSQDLLVKFSPTTETTESGSITLTTQDTDFPSVAVSISGKGVKPHFALGPNPLDFGDLRVGTSVTQKVTMNNSGTGPIVISSFSTGTGTPFTLVSPPSTPFTLAAGASQDLTVKFSPTSEAVATGTLTLTTQDSDWPSVSVSLSGRGVKPHFALSPSPLDFGDLRVGTTLTQKVTMSNSGGTGPIVISSFSTGAGTPFTLVSPPSTPFTLAAGASQDLTVKFSPTSEGAATGALTLTTQDSDWPSVSVSLSGRGVQPHLSLSPNPLDFGGQRVGTSVTKLVAVNNSGTGPIVISTLSLSGSSAFTLVSPPSTPFTLGPGGSQNLSVSFSPTSEITESGSITLTTQDTDFPSVTLSITGRGVKPNFALGPNPLDFGDLRVGATLTKMVTMSNSGSGPIVISSFSTGTGTPFTLVSPPSTPFTLGAGGSQDLTVQFSPTSEGVATGTLTLTTQDSSWPSVSVSLSGKGVRPNLVLDPNPLAFGQQIVGTTSTAQTVTVRNSGTGPIVISTLSTGTGSPFALVSPPSTPFTLGPGGVQPLSVSFSPTTLGSASNTGTLTLTTDATPATVPLSGTGVSWLNMDPADQLDFGEVPRGQTVSRTVTITNASTATLHITSVSSLAAPFSVSGPSTTTLGSHAATTFTVSFNPSGAGPFSAVLTLQSDAANSPHTLRLAGTGTVPEGQLSQPGGDAISSLNFDAVRVNATVSRTVRLTNIGQAPLVISTVPTMSAGAFSLQWPTTTAITIPAGTYIDFQVSFTPTSTISYSGTLTINSNAVNSPMVLSLTGFGSNPQLNLAPTSIFFGDVRVGSSGSPTPVTLTNTGNAEVFVQSLPVEGPFTVALRPGDTLPRSVVAGHPFTFDVSFKPSAQGAATGSVTLLTDYSTGTPLNVSLTGNGTISTASLSATALDFGAQRVKATSGAQVVTIKNEGMANLEIWQFVLPNGFAISSPLPLPTSSTPLVVGPGGLQPVSVTFTPGTVGSVTGQLNIVSNAFTQAAPVNLSGAGVDGQISLTPNYVSFTGVDVGGTGQQQSVTLTNMGDYTLTITNLTPPADSTFTISGLYNGQSVLPKQTLPFTVTFKPVARGYVSSSAIIGSDSVMNPAYIMALQGTGVAAAVDLQPPDVFFGKSNVAVPTTQNLTIKNVGERDLYVSNISFADAATGTTGASLDFSIDGTVTFPMVVGSHASTNVPLKFTPRAVGQRQARAIVYTNDKAAEANLVGEGTSPNLQLSLSSLDFGNVMAGKTSAPRILRITNTGNGPLTLSASSMTVGGADATAFILTPPALPLTLQQDGFTELTVSFRPDAERLFSAQLVVQSNDTDTPSVTVPMSGAGVHQQIQLSDSSLEFGQQLINNTSSPHKVSVTNSSDTNVTLTALAVEGVGASQFTTAKLTLPLVLTPGAVQDVGATFTPLAETDVNCTLKITFSDLPLPLTVAVHGKGIPSVLSIKPSPLDFGGVRAGGARRDQPLTITNLSSETIVLAEPEATYSTGEPFLYDGASLNGRSIDPGMSVIMTVGYQPMVETLSETTLSFGTTTPPQPRSVDVKLQGRATLRLLSVDPASLDFGRVDVNAPMDPKVITITNKSGQQQRVVVMLKDAEGAPYKLDTKALADPIPPGGTATFTVAFVPDKAGQADNEVQVWLQGGTEAEALIPVTGHGRSITGGGGGCSSSSAETGSAGMLMLLALVGLGSRRRRRG